MPNESPLSNKIIEPGRAEMNNVAFAPRDDSDRPRHPPSLCPHEERLGL